MTTPEDQNRSQFPVHTLLFRPEHIPLIRDGRLTVTRRSLGRRKIRLNSICLAKSSESDTDLTSLKVIDIWRQKLGNISYREMHLEGYNTPDEYKASWEELNGLAWDPDRDIWVIRFEVVPGDPVQT